MLTHLLHFGGIRYCCSTGRVQASASPPLIWQGDSALKIPLQEGISLGISNEGNILPYDRDVFLCFFQRDSDEVRLLRGKALSEVLGAMRVEV